MCCLHPWALILFGHCNLKSVVQSVSPGQDSHICCLHTWTLRLLWHRNWESVVQSLRLLQRHPRQNFLKEIHRRGSCSDWVRKRSAIVALRNSGSTSSLPRLLDFALNGCSWTRGRMSFNLRFLARRTVSPKCATTNCHSDSVAKRKRIKIIWLFARGCVLNPCI